MKSKKILYEQQLNQLRQDESHIEFFIKIAKEEVRKKPEETKALLESVIHICKEQNYQKAYAQSIGVLGWYYYDIGDYRQALKLHLEAENIYIEMKDFTKLLPTYSAQLVSYMELGLFELALEIGRKGLQLIERNKEDAGAISLLLNTSILYIELEDYEGISDLVERLEHLKAKLNGHQIYCLTSIKAELYYRLNELEVAEGYYDEAIELINEYDYQYYLPGTLCLGGKIKYKQKKYDECEKQFQRALNYADQYNQPNVKIEIIIQYKDYLEHQGLWKEVEAKILEALNIAHEINSFVNIRKLYKDLSEIYKKMNEFEKALESLELYIKYEKEVMELKSSISFLKHKNHFLKDKVDMYKALYKKINRLSNTGKEFTLHLDKASIFKVIYEQINKLLDINICGIALYEKSSEVLKYKFFICDDEEKNLGSVSFNKVSHLGVKCFETQKEIIINNFQAYTKEHVEVKGEVEGVESVIYMPLMIGNRAIGMITIQSNNKDAYNTNDIHTLEIITSYAAIAIWNATLFKKVNYLANHDELTKVLTRREIMAQGENKLKQAKEIGKPLNILILDIDYFKVINDTYGHPTGDQVLKQVAKIIKDNVREGDLVGRYGGEEFIILLYNATKEDTERVAYRIKSSIHDSLIKCYNGVNIKVSVSIGVYHYYGDEETFIDGITYADKALYKAKHNGRNRVEIYSE